MTFQCSKCGICCSNLDRGFVVIALKEDRESIAHNLNRPLSQIENDFFEINHEFSEISGSRVYQTRSTEGRCVFLSSDLSCSIHAYKPFQCRHGPERLFTATMAESYECMIGFENQTDHDIEREFFEKLFSGG